MRQTCSRGGAPDDAGHLGGHTGRRDAAGDVRVAVFVGPELEPGEEGIRLGGLVRGEGGQRHDLALVLEAGASAARW
jgi:hypothetical protein